MELNVKYFLVHGALVNYSAVHTDLCQCIITLAKHDFHVKKRKKSQTWHGHRNLLAPCGTVEVVLLYLSF